MKKTIIFGLILFLSILSMTPVMAFDDPDNDGIPGLRGIDYDLVVMHHEKVDMPEYKQEKDNILPRLMPGYSIRTVRHNGGGSSPFSISQTGIPGGTITFSNKASITISADTSFGISAGDVSAKVGFSISETYSTTLTYSYKIPSKYNGKSVKSCKVYPRAEYETYAYDFYFLEMKTGTGFSDEVTGINYVHLFTYN